MMKIIQQIFVKRWKPILEEWWKYNDRDTREYDYRKAIE
jgi:hypothetical protein